MIATIIKQISERLIINVAEVKHIDEYGGPSYLERNVAITYPCVFVEILPVVWQDTPQNTQKANIDIKIHALTEVIADTYLNKKNKPEAQKAIEFYDIAPLIHFWLQGFNPADNQFYQFGKMTRTNSQSEVYPVANLRLFTMNYKMTVVDISRTVQNYEDLFPADVRFEDEIDFVEEGMPLADGN